METHRTEREQRDATRKAAWDSAARNEGVNRGIQGMGGGAKKNTLADRAKVRRQSLGLYPTDRHVVPVRSRLRGR